MKPRNFRIMLLLGALVWSFALYVFLASAKDTNDLGQYDDQMVADILSASDDMLYPILKIFRPDWAKLDQSGQTIASSQRLLAIYNELLALYSILESSYGGVVNDSSCGDEGAVTLYSWQIRDFGGLPGYCYFLPEKAKLKIERVALQTDGSGWVKNIACVRDTAGLAGVMPGQEQYILDVLTNYFPGFKWGNLIWGPDDKVSFAVEVLALPAG